MSRLWIVAFVSLALACDPEAPPAPTPDQGADQGSAADQDAALAPIALPEAPRAPDACPGARDPDTQLCLPLPPTPTDSRCPPNWQRHPLAEVASGCRPRFTEQECPRNQRIAPGGCVPLAPPCEVLPSVDELAARYGAPVTVVQGQDLQAAIDAAAPGAILFLPPREYRGPVEIERDVHLLAPCDGAILQVSGEETGILVTRGHLVLEGLSIQAERRGIGVDTEGELTARDLHVFGGRDTGLLSLGTVRLENVAFSGADAVGIFAKGPLSAAGVTVLDALYAIGVEGAEVTLTDVNTCPQNRPDSMGLVLIGAPDAPTRLTVQRVSVSCAEQAGVLVQAGTRLDGEWLSLVSDLEAPSPDDTRERWHLNADDAEVDLRHVTSVNAPTGVRFSKNSQVRLRDAYIFNAGNAGRARGALWVGGGAALEGAQLELRDVEPVGIAAGVWVDDPPGRLALDDVLIDGVLRQRDAAQYDALNGGYAVSLGKRLAGIRLRRLRVRRARTALSVTQGLPRGRLVQIEDLHLQDAAERPNRPVAWDQPGADAPGYGVVLGSGTVEATRVYLERPLLTGLYQASDQIATLAQLVIRDPQPYADLFGGGLVSHGELRLEGAAIHGARGSAWVNTGMATARDLWLTRTTVTGLLDRENQRYRLARALAHGGPGRLTLERTHIDDSEGFGLTLDGPSDVRDLLVSRTRRDPCELSQLCLGPGWWGLAANLEVAPARFERVILRGSATAALRTTVDFEAHDLVLDDAPLGQIVEAPAQTGALPVTERAIRGGQPPAEDFPGFDDAAPPSAE